MLLFFVLESVSGATAAFLKFRWLPDAFIKCSTVLPDPHKKLPHISNSDTDKHTKEGEETKRWFVHFVKSVFGNEKKSIQ